MNIPGILSETGKIRAFAYDPSKSLGDLVADYLLSQRNALGDPAMNWSDEGLLAATYYHPSKTHDSIGQFVAALQRLSSQKGMESFSMSPYETIAEGPKRRIYTIPVKFTPESSATQQLEVQVTYHWKKY